MNENEQLTTLESMAINAARVAIEQHQARLKAVGKNDGEGIKQVLMLLRMYSFTYGASAELLRKLKEKEEAQSQSEPPNAEESA